MTQPFLPYRRISRNWQKPPSLFRCRAYGRNHDLPGRSPVSQHAPANVSSQLVKPEGRCPRRWTHSNFEGTCTYMPRCRRSKMERGFSVSRDSTVRTSRFKHPQIPILYMPDCIQHLLPTKIKPQVSPVHAASGPPTQINAHISYSTLPAFCSPYSNHHHAISAIFLVVLARSLASYRKKPSIDPFLPKASRIRHRHPHGHCHCHRRCRTDWEWVFRVVRVIVVVVVGAVVSFGLGSAVVVSAGLSHVNLLRIFPCPYIGLFNLVGVPGGCHLLCVVVAFVFGPVTGVAIIVTLLLINFWLVTFWLVTFLPVTFLFVTLLFVTSVVAIAIIPNFFSHHGFVRKKKNPDARD
ncbi:hypothetical protein QBC32DRAFT_350377, partial [Pseudoneurospora amorphoporcata]